MFLFKKKKKPKMNLTLKKNIIPPLLRLEERRTVGYVLILYFVIKMLAGQSTTKNSWTECFNNCGMLDSMGFRHQLSQADNGSLLLESMRCGTNCCRQIIEKLIFGWWQLRIIVGTNWKNNFLSAPIGRIIVGNNWE